MAYFLPFLLTALEGVEYAFAGGIVGNSLDGLDNFAFGLEVCLLLLALVAALFFLLLEYEVDGGVIAIITLFTLSNGEFS